MDNLITNDELNALVKQKMDLLKLNDEKKITDKEFFQKSFELERKIKEVRERVVAEGIKNDALEAKQREQKLQTDYQKMVRDYNKVMGKEYRDWETGTVS